jgi:AraC-like DNA-binding protein
MQLDLLSAALETIHMRCVVFPRSQLSAPWGIRFPKSMDEVPVRYRPPIEEIPEPMRNRLPEPCGGFHAVTRGSCRLEIEGERDPISLVAGDLVVFLHTAGHVLRDSATSLVRPIWEVHRPEQARERRALVAGGGGSLTTIISGLYFIDKHNENRLLSALPNVIHIRAEDGQSQRWLDDTLRLLGNETSQEAPGAVAVIHHLAQVLFIQTVRAYVETIPATSTGWLRAMMDPEIGPALGHIHVTPGAPWTVASLANAVAMSRSAFAARFTELVGEPPLQYLTMHRMQRATRLLQESEMPIKAIAAAAGYGSEAAFSKAFRRSTGTSPSACRKQASPIGSGTITAPVT